MATYVIETEGHEVDAVGAQPSTTAVSCDTKKCQDYVEQVDNMSRELTNQWRAFAEHIDDSKLSDAKKADFAAEFSTWVQTHHLPWADKKDALKKECDSTLPGPCREAQNVAESHENAVIDFSKKLKYYTGKDTGIKEVDQGKTGSNDKGGGGLINLNIGGGTILLILLLLAGVGYMMFGNKGSSSD